MTPITVYKEDIENAIEKLNGSTVNGILRAINILQNALLVSTTAKPCINASEAYHREAISQELNNKYIIVEILDILTTFGHTESISCMRVLGDSTMALKAKLVGNK